MRTQWPGVGTVGPAGPAGAAGLPGITPISWRNSGLTGANVFYEVGSSRDGSRVFAVESDRNSDGKLWLSSDYGATWAESFPDGSASHRNMAVACDATGMILVAAMIIWVFGFKVFRSVNGGATWSDITPAGMPLGGNPAIPMCCTVSGDGQKILFSWANNGYARSYLSLNGGVAWTLDPLAAPALQYNYFVSAASSYDGKYLAILRGNLDCVLFLSGDYGATWAAVPPAQIPIAASINNPTISMSSSGQFLVVADGASGGYISVDYGATWTNKAAPVGAGGQYSASAIIASGSIVLLAGSTNAACVLSISRDFGATWTDEVQPIVAGQSAKGELCAAVDEYAARFIFGTDAGSTPGKQVFQSFPGLVPSGYSGPVALAAITVGGTDGSLALVNGLITAYTPPT